MSGPGNGPGREAPRAAPGVRRPRWLSFFVLPAVVALLGYGYTLGDFFLADDFLMLHHGANAEGWREAATLGPGWSARWFRPLPLAGWWLQFELFALEPFGYRATNLLLHVVNAGLCAWLVASLTGHAGAGAVAGTTFAALPSHAEAVTWLSARFDPLCALGILVCLLAWTRYATAAAARPRYLVLAALGLLWAVASKEPGLGVLLMLPVVSLGYLGRPTRRHWIGYAALVTLGAGCFLWRWSVVGGVGGPVTSAGDPVLLRFEPGQIARFTLQAVRACLVPVSPVRFPAPWHPLVWVPAAALLLGLAACVRAGCLARRLRLAWPFAVLFLIALLPMATWVQIGSDNQSTRFLYVPSLFSCAAIGLVFVSWREARWRDAGAWLPPAVLVAAWTIGLGLENRSWHAASASARRILDAFPPPEEIHGQRIHVLGLPDNRDGAFVYRNSFSFALRLFTAERRSVTQESAQAPAAGLPAPGPDTAVLRWDTGRERWAALR